MKKLFIVVIVALLLSGCSMLNFATGVATRNVTPNQLLSSLPAGFEYVGNAGNGWHYCVAGNDKYLVSIQGVGSSGSFVQMTWIGKDE